MDQQNYPQGAPVPGQPLPPQGMPVPPQGFPPQGAPVPMPMPMPGQPVPPPYPGMPYGVQPVGMPLQGIPPQGVPPQGIPPQGMPQQPAGGAVFAPGRHHVSKAYLAIQMVGTVVPLIFTFLIILVSAGVPLGTLAVMGEEVLGFFAVLAAGLVFALVLAAFSIGFTWLSWKNLEYQLTAKEFALFSGIVFKKRMHVPYQKIQSVNQSASVFKRIFGLCDLEIDTAGGADNTAIRIPCLKTVNAEILRTEIFRRKNVLLAGGTIDENGCIFMPDARFAPTAPAAEDVMHESNVLDSTKSVWDAARTTRGDAFIDTGRVIYERGLSNVELIWASVTGSTVFLRAILGFLVLGAMGLTQFIDVLLGSVFAEQFFVTTVDLTHMSAKAIFGTFVLPLMLGIAGVLLVVWLASVLATVVSYGGFRVRRRETRIEVEHGLLRHVFQGLDVERVQSVIITQTFIRRLFGYCEVSLGKIDSISAEDSASTQLSSRSFVVHPCIKVDKVPELLAGIVPEFAEQPNDFVTLPKVARRRAINRWGFLYSAMFWVVLGVALLQILASQGVINLIPVTGEDIFAAELVVGFLPLVYLLFAFVLVKNIVKAILWHKESGLAYNKKFMRIRAGGYTVTDVMFPRRKIQSGYTKTNPFQRHAHVKTVCARLASGMGQSIALMDVADAEADAWLEWVRPRQNAKSEELFAAVSSQIE